MSRTHRRVPPWLAVWRRDLELQGEPVEPLHKIEQHTANGNDKWEDTNQRAAKRGEKAAARAELKRLRDEKNGLT